MSAIHFHFDGEAHWLECWAGSRTDMAAVVRICQVRPGDSWDDLITKVTEHQASHGCSEAGSADPERFPLTCEWCRNSPATHLLITDLKGGPSTTRHEHRVCGPCAHGVTVLPPSFIGFWLFHLVPDRCEAVDRVASKGGG